MKMYASRGSPKAWQYSGSTVSPNMQYSFPKYAVQWQYTGPMKMYASRGSPEMTYKQQSELEAAGCKLAS
jgi:hypothetical protein